MSTLSFWRVAASAIVLLSHFVGAVTTKAHEFSAMVTITEIDNDKAIDVRVGEAIKIELPENATTGYRWSLDPVNKSLVETLESKSDYKSEGVGSGGNVMFSFKIISVGSTDISLKYWRHFEGDQSITKRFRVRLNVQPQ